jgi:hypothetical protein
MKDLQSRVAGAGGGWQVSAKPVLGWQGVDPPKNGLYRTWLAEAPPLELGRLLGVEVTSCQWWKVSTMDVVIPASERLNLKRLELWE